MVKKTLKYGLFLCVLGIIVGVLLSVVNAITKPIIEEQENEKVQSMLKEYNDTYAWSENVSNNYSNLDNDIQAIYIGRENGLDKVYVYQVKGLGYGNGEIVSMVYIENDVVSKVSIVSASGQTKGVGTNALEEEFLTNSYVGNSVVNYCYIKATEHSNKEVDVLSGATYTSRGVLSSVIVACKHYNSEVTQ